MLADIFVQKATLAHANSKDVLARFFGRQALAHSRRLRYEEAELKFVVHFPRRTEDNLVTILELAVRTRYASARDDDTGCTTVIADRCIRKSLRNLSQL